MRIPINTALALGALAFTSACLDPDQAGDDTPSLDDDGGEITQLTGERAALFGTFEVGKTWPKDYLSVCWMDELSRSTDPDVVALMAAGRAVVMKEWSRVGRVRFGSLWGSCTDEPDADIRIGRVSDEGILGRSKIGTSALEVPAGEPTMILAFDVWTVGACDGNPNGMCNTSSEPDALDPADVASFEHVILHEFGHALGLRHEHARDDDTCNATAEVLDPEGYDGEPLWAYDAGSVMSYCTGGNRLSVGDIRTLNTLYPGVVGLYDGSDLAHGSSGGAAPLRLGPGYYTTAEVPTLSTISSIVVPPGYRVRACTTTSCAYFTSTVRTLSSTYNDRIVNLEVAPWVIGAAGIGYDGTSERFGVGAHSASAFQVIGDNTMSSVFVPATRAATVCASSTGGAPCSGPHVGGGVPAAFKLPAGVDNAVSYVAVTPRVATYSSRFTGTSYALAAGTYKASTNAPWLTDVRALAIAGLEVRACTAEGSSPVPGSGGAGDCRTYTQSVDLAAAAHTGLRYLKISAPIVTAP